MKFSESFSFHCQRCGYCCTQHGEYTCLYLTGKDIERLAAALKMTPASFRKRHTRVSGRKRLLVFRNRVCPFYQHRTCTVHESKPEQCATWPYWKENFRNGKILPSLKRICPGIRTEEKPKSAKPRRSIRSRKIKNKGN